MFTVALYSLASIIGISLISLVGVLFFIADAKFIQRSLLPLVGFSTGALLGDVFLHMLPEIAENYEAFPQAMLLALSGILLSFVVEKIIHWHHCHLLPGDGAHHQEQHHPVGYLCLIGDGVHNFIDGVLIAGSFLVSTKIGLATTIAVVLHEIPQEIGDFAVLLHSNFSRSRAICLNLLSAATAVLGAVLVLLTSGAISSLSHYLLPFAAGNFLYIAGSDLIPELHRQTQIRQSLLQLMAMICGIGFLYLMLFLE